MTKAYSLLYDAAQRYSKCWSADQKRAFEDAMEWMQSIGDYCVERMKEEAQEKNCGNSREKPVKFVYVHFELDKIWGIVKTSNLCTGDLAQVKYFIDNIKDELEE